MRRWQRVWVFPLASVQDNNLISKHRSGLFPCCIVSLAATRTSAEPLSRAPQNYLACMSCHSRQTREAASDAGLWVFGVRVSYTCTQRRSRRDGHTPSLETTSSGPGKVRQQQYLHPKCVETIRRACTMHDRSLVPVLVQCSLYYTQHEETIRCSSLNTLMVTKHGAHPSLCPAQSAIAHSTPMIELLVVVEVILALLNTLNLCMFQQQPQQEQVQSSKVSISLLRAAASRLWELENAPNS